MDTSNSIPNNQTIYELESSDHPEDKELVPKYWEVLKALIGALKPLLRYVATLQDFTCSNGGILRIKAVKVGVDRGGYDIFLSSKGGIVFAAKEMFVGIPSVLKDDSIFLLGKIPLLELVTYLHVVLRDAKEKHEQHVTSIGRQLAKLDEILSVLKS